MTLSQKQIRQRVGLELGGIILTGTASSVTTTQINDTSNDSPLDPGDTPQRLSGCGLFILDFDGANNNIYRQNCVYVPGNQRLTFGTATGLTATPEYEVYREPLLNPLTVMPTLISDALKKIRRLAFPHIYLNDRGFYDLSRFPDILGPERVRRLYWVGDNLFQNADFLDWPTAAAAPTHWTSVSGTPTHEHVPNYPNGAGFASGSGFGLQQIISVGVQSRRIRISSWWKPANASTLRVVITPQIDTGGTPEGRTITQTQAGDGSTIYEMVQEVETTPRTVQIQCTFDLSVIGVSTTQFWAPVAYPLSRGQRKRIQPLNVYNEDNVQRMYVPKRRGVAQFALLLPYATVATPNTTTIDNVTTTAPDELVVAAVCVEVLRWLVGHPDIPAQSKTEYGRLLVTWTSKFRQRAREHMRKLAKSQQIWEAGEVN